MKSAYIALIIIAISLVGGLMIYVFSSAFTSEKVMTVPKTNVLIDAVYQGNSQPVENTYDGIVISTNRQGNVTAFTFADGFVADSNGNVVSDPDGKIKLQTKLSIKYLQASPVCSINVTFPNGTKIVGYQDIQLLNNDTLYNKTLVHADKICTNGGFIKQIKSWQIIP